VGSWFDDNLRRVVSNGSSTLFLWNAWLKEVPLCLRFGHIFYLVENKLSSVAKMSTLS
jgi:hypothetical protein